MALIRLTLFHLITYIVTMVPPYSLSCQATKGEMKWSATSVMALGGVFSMVVLLAFLSNTFSSVHFLQIVAAHNNNDVSILSKILQSGIRTDPLQSLEGPETTTQQRRILQELPQMNKAVSLRIFGPALEGYNNDNQHNLNDHDISFAWFSKDQQRTFLQEHERTCWKDYDENTKSSSSLVQRFDEFATAPFLQTEIWKFCVFSTGLGNLFWDRSQMVPSITWEDLWNRSDPEKHTALLISPVKKDTIPATSSIAAAVSASSWIHPSFLRMDGIRNHNNHNNNNNENKDNRLSTSMLRLLLETEETMLKSNPLYTYQALAQHIQNDDDHHWNLWKAQCQVPSPQNPVDQVLIHWQRNHPPKRQKYSERNTATIAQPDQTPLEFSHLPTYGLHCTIKGGYCCQVWKNGVDSMPVMMLKHPFGTTGGITVANSATSVTDNQQQLKLKQQRQLQSWSPKGTSIYWSTITAVPTADSASRAVTKLETPNFFDILLQNNCLPTSEACHICLKRYTSTTGCDEQCHKECPCYCKVLCQIRPPPKQIQAVWYVSPPLYQLQQPLPPRLIPRIIHQTWYEPLEKDKYPNMSRLQQSWKQSGWEHVFYDDAKAAKFLQEHFPPQVLEAYHAIQPGAFKADLFRYCVLLIQGGVYADMDVLLESNLEEAIAPDVGFMTPMDEPGIKVDHQACLWNGFMAVAPAHPFVAKTIELVVNNIRNRFTSVDYDDMLCPDPILSASHLWDILFTTGPCILGTATNVVLQRHPQTGFKTGEIDIWGTIPKHDSPLSSLTINNSDKKRQRKQAPLPQPFMVESNDPRLAIPGRSIILRQNKNDMGAHRFTLDERNLVVCSTDMPDYDDRPKKPHYAESGKQTSLYGTTQLYSDFQAANEEIRLVVVGSMNNYTL